MAPSWRIPGSLCSLITYRAAIMCVAALSMLWARSAPTHFAYSSHSLTFQTAADHDHRQCFDHEDSQLASAPSGPQIFSPPAVSSRAIYAAASFVEFENDGWHYNRPPPIN
jgi:hypothetical protein